MIRVVLVFLISMLFGWSNPAHSKERMTPFQLGDSQVASEYREATAELNAAKPLRWSFYFSAKSRKKLAGTITALKTKLYVVVRESQIASGKHKLQIARTEIHSADSLNQRLEALAELSKSQGIFFEGWSVSPEVN
jgi:Regulator of ribonuclease activity B